ncbi:Methyltransferase domain-containing protein [Rhizobium sp. NFR07]|uniref:class I SAM-dependent methyltransferase n=1 Tax=Rhizobium sp. NFR07 TaxID=1566262 RepID=UPI0008E32DF2|nr:class I SAM-dependent methyltransferase [Rhizobium sp. NFR07]SFB59619.1 Methyltransferase domain-containing protein [Rhizobium sp. NFR07]
MTETSVRKEALNAIRELLARGNKKEAVNVANLFRTNLKKSSVDDLTFYGKLMTEVGFVQEAEKLLRAAIKKAEPNNYTQGLETLFWHLRIPPRMRDIRAGVALAQTLSLPDVQSVLDVGSGGGEHALAFANAGKQVHCVDYGTSVYVQNSAALAEADAHSNIRKSICDFMELNTDGKYDLVWCSHVLEHQTNPNLFLRKCLAHTAERGWLAITVPPLKHQIVGGHVTLWNAGLLLYQLVHAGNNCSDALVMNYDYNISVLVQKNPIILPTLDWDAGDINRLHDYFPPGCTEGFDGRLYGHAIRRSTSEKT